MRPARGETDEDAAARIADLRKAVRAHPVHGDPDLPDIEVWARRHDDLLRETERLERSVRRRTGSLVRQFDRILDVLTALGYLDGDETHPHPTAQGLWLAGLYAETDLVLAECLRSGLLDGLDAADLAAVASVFTFETRSKEPPVPVFPNGTVRNAVAAIADVWQDIVEREEAASLPPTRVPDAGFVDVVWRWASGADLDDTLAGTDLTAGDFVRATKQTADLLGQIRDVMAGSPLSDAARAAGKSLIRGVVAYTGL